MQPSPIQLQRVIFNKVCVEPNVANQKPISAVGYDFDGVNIKAEIGLGQKPGQEEDPRDFLLRLEVSIDNTEGKAAPYSIDIEVMGLFNVAATLSKQRREDLLTVNGASILYGSIREMVLAITSRFAPGPLTLPGVNFEDDAPSARGGDKQSEVPVAPSRQARKRVTRD